MARLHLMEKGDETHPSVEDASSALIAGQYTVASILVLYKVIEKSSKAVV